MEFASLGDHRFGDFVDRFVGVEQVDQLDR